MRTCLLLFATSSMIACMPPIGDGQNATSVTADGDFDPGRRDDGDQAGDTGDSNGSDDNGDRPSDLLEPGSACNCDSECRQHYSH